MGTLAAPFLAEPPTACPSLTAAIISTITAEPFVAPCNKSQIHSQLTVGKKGCHHCKW